MLRHRRFVHLIVGSLLAVSALIAGASPAGAVADVAWLTGSSPNDGIILGAINKTGGSSCDAITALNSAIILNLLVDCNADGQNIVREIHWAAGQHVVYRLCTGLYFGGAWTPQTCSLPFTSPVTA